MSDHEVCGRYPSKQTKESASNTYKPTLDHHSLAYLPCGDANAAEQSDLSSSVDYSGKKKRDHTQDRYRSGE